MSLSNIVGKIQSDARLEAEELRLHAEERAKEILLAQQDEAKAEASKIRERALAERDSQIQRLIAAEKTQRKRSFGRKTKTYTKILEEALHSFETMDDSAYEAYITDLLLSAVTKGMKKSS